MKQTTLETDYQVGKHSWLEREIHRRLPPGGGCLTRAQLKERQELSDEIFKANYKIATKIVVCEVCEDYLAECLLSGNKPFAQPATVRTMLQENERSVIAANIARIAQAFNASSA